MKGNKKVCLCRRSKMRELKFNLNNDKFVLECSDIERGKRLLMILRNRREIEKNMYSLRRGSAISDESLFQPMKFIFQCALTPHTLFSAHANTNTWKYVTISIETNASQELIFISRHCHKSTKQNIEIHQFHLKFHCRRAKWMNLFIVVQHNMNMPLSNLSIPFQIWVTERLWL